MEENRLAMEEGIPTHSLILKEQHDFIDYKKILHLDEETWRLKSQSLAQLRGQKHEILSETSLSQTLEKQGEGDHKIIWNKNQIQEEAKNHFEQLLTEEGNANPNIQ